MENLALGYNNLCELSSIITNKLKDFNISNADLILRLERKDKEKLEEDIYYRGSFNKDGDAFKPTKRDVKLKMDNLSIIIQEKR